MLLLDTSVFVWAIARSHRIGPLARARLDAEQGALVSAASIVELTIKSVLGKIEIPDDLASRLANLGFQELVITADHAASIRRFPELGGHDPFDRLLVAQAAATGSDLLTADRLLLGLGLKFVVDASR